jgi:hypothetical protein
MSKKEKSLQQIPEHIPDSLRGWFVKENRGPLTLELIAEQIFDLSALIDSSWSFFEWFQYQIHSSFQELMREALAFRLIDSKEKVRTYFEYELLKGKDPFNLISKISMSGAGIRSLYQRLLTMASIETLDEYKKKAILQMLEYWDEATIDILCDKEAFFTRTDSGNEGTLSEFLGTSISFEVRLTESPLMKDGRYNQRFLTALDYDGIVDGKYPRDKFDEFYYQNLLLQFVFHSQSTDNRLGEEFWKPIQQVEDFLQLSHEVAVTEQFENANDLLIRAMMFAWKEAQRDKLVYGWAACHILDDHFEGKTAETKFLAQIHPNLDEIDECLIDYVQISEKKPDMLVLLESEAAGDGLTITFAKVGETYEENTVLFHPQKGFQSQVDRKIAKKLKNLIEEFEIAKQEYLERLSDSILPDREKKAPRQNI